MAGGDESSAEAAATLFRSIDSLRRIRSQKRHLESIAASLQETEKRLEATTVATSAAQSAKEEEERQLQTLQRELREAEEAEEALVARSDASRPIVRSLAKLSLGGFIPFRSLTDARSAFREELCRFLSSHTPSSLSSIVAAWREHERHLESRLEENLSTKLATQLELTTLRKQASEETSPPDLAPLTQTVDRLRSELEATAAVASEAEETQFAELLRRKQTLEDSLRGAELELERLPRERGGKKKGDRSKGIIDNKDNKDDKDDKDKNNDNDNTTNTHTDTTRKRRRVETAPCELSGTALRVVCWDTLGL